MSENKFFDNLDKVRAFLAESNLSLEELYNIIMLIFKVSENSNGNKNTKLNKNSITAELIFKNDPKKLADFTENFFKLNNFQPSSIRTILKFFEKENFDIMGINKGAALGSALRGDGRFIFQKEDKLWQLK